MTKYHRLGGLNHVYFLMVLEPGKFRPRCWQIWFLTRALFLAYRWTSFYCILTWWREVLVSLPFLIRALFPMGTPPSWPHLNLFTSQRSHLLISLQGAAVMASTYEFGRGQGHIHIVYNVGGHLTLSNNFQGGRFVSKKLIKILNLLICLFKQNPIFLCMFYRRHGCVSSYSCTVWKLQ